MKKLKVFIGLFLGQSNGKLFYTTMVMGSTYKTVAVNKCEWGYYFEFHARGDNICMDALEIMSRYRSQPSAFSI